jgi:polysaccharide biosynthesis transport protein
MRGDRGTAPNSRHRLARSLSALRRNLWLILLVFALATAASVYFSYRQAKRYESSADVFLGTITQTATFSGSTTSLDPARQRAIQVDLAQDPAVAVRALKLVHIAGRTPRDLLDHSSVSARTPDLLTFSVNDSNPIFAERLAEAYARAYTRYRGQLDATATARALKDVQRRLADLAAAGGANSSAYADLLNAEQQLTTAQVLRGSSAPLVRAASPARQTQPKVVRNGVVAAVLGLIFGVGLAFGREAMNTRVRDATEVEERLQLPLLGRLPPPPRSLRSKSRVLMLAKPRSVEAEAYRILAASLEFANLDRGARTIMFTSALRGEGKSTTVANLAVALARAGKRVVVVDLDLRQPSLAPFFELGERPGIADVALGRSDLEHAVEFVPVYDGADAARAHSFDGQGEGWLAVLGAGRVADSAPELVGSPTISDILTSLERGFDLVLIDVPPILGLSDAMTMTAKVDGAVIVARQGVIKHGMLQELRRVLDDTPVPKLGFVLTGADGPEAYGYGYAGPQRRRSRAT